MIDPSFCFSMRWACPPVSTPHPAHATTITELPNNFVSVGEVYPACFFPNTCICTANHINTSDNRDPQKPFLVPRGHHWDGRVARLHPVTPSNYETAKQYRKKSASMDIPKHVFLSRLISLNQKQLLVQRVPPLGEIHSRQNSLRFT
ncbi:hypothetical protein CDAR_371741 [Caerostris darwini]|uniref:Uncharacterized protein n=1 Tax=Caerostris darwini TaxID=1538125 RepID=A0AAV4T6X2_9ARAC|nr:hypothetical protein CDAR_371741 [Caerostris darwini]